MAGAAAFDLEKELEPVLDQGRELAAMTANDKPSEAGRQQILPPDAGGKDEKAIDKKERVAIINKVKVDRGLTGKTAYFDAQRIAMQEGLLPAKKAKAERKKKVEQKPDEPPKKRGRRADRDKGDILQKIMDGGDIDTDDEFASARGVLKSLNSMPIRALKTNKEGHAQYTQKYIAVERAINQAAPRFDPKYGAREADTNKAARAAINHVAKLNELAQHSISETREKDAEIREKDAEIARLKAMLAGES